MTETKFSRAINTIIIIIKFIYLNCFNEGFITHFIGGDGKVEPLQAECKRRYGFLLEREPTFPVITELGGEEKVETTLFEMFALLKMQSRGQKGVLVVNGYPNTFFIRDMFGVLCVVTGRWGNGGWVVRANLTKDFGTLPAGAQFFWPD